ncbi:MAG: zinc ABC transporter substrate-binding protein [Sphaerochaeta sp.]|jgi:zinc transport system substrate-binding protein|nr:zinc ABC transporter substrate-binding protein [Sphaerochaeta sp.]PKL27550.1 MAG: metal ABC transporter substrate-binding protein [Spirochaetae bacterium HGW-Spirochaetae-2]
MKNPIAIILMVITISLSPLSASGNNEAKKTDTPKPVVAVSILPQQYVVDRIAGDLVETVVLVGPGQSPHSYEPTPRQMSALSQADVWILSNTDFELSLRPKVTSMYPKLMVVDGTEGVTFRYLEDHGHEEGEDEDDHGDAQEHAYQGELDRHTWLGREPMRILATHTARTLAKLDPVHADTYAANLAVFLEEVDTLFTNLKQELAALRGTTVFVYHPSFGYLLDDLGIAQEAVETGGKEPTAKALSLLIEEARKDKVPALFVQAQFPVSAAKSVAQAVGAQVLPLDPLAYDWIANIRLIGETLRQALLESGQGDD